MKKKMTIFLLFAVLSASTQAQSIPKLPNSYSPEQKIYELSMVWKEVSYNFDNFQDDTQAQFDSIYQAFIPLIMSTPNDLEYCKTIQQFLAHCNNDHTGLRSWDNPLLDNLIARPYLRTLFRDDKILISNFADYYAENLRIGDEILEINHTPALEYIQEHYIPYFSATNKENKIHYAMFARGLAYHYPLNTPIELKLLDAITLKEKEVTILADRKLNDSVDMWFVHDFRNDITNFFFQDTIHKISYVRLRNSSQATTAFFVKHISEMDESKTLILDLSEHVGGAGRYDNVIWNYLINKESIRGAYYSTRSHFPYYKSHGSDYCTGKYEVSQGVIDAYCPYYNGTAYLSLQQWGQEINADTIPHFQGNVYVIIGRNCGSAGEQLVTMLSQDEKIRFFGNKTSGATGRPYIFTLPSGLEIMVETGKFYNFQQEDISAGINPKYFIDFFDCYGTSQANELLECINDKIKQVLENE
ncbi:MAG: hypothetical protein LBV02_04550 [Bacteroidales bacterium]|jgi:C-terminal processing protease CtpA/Prc|nr:hypothetical protein [Bacteroidales bacterium]